VQAHNRGFAYEPGEVTAVDREGRSVHVAALLIGEDDVLPERSLGYDTLVLAVGSEAIVFNDVLRTRMPGPPREKAQLGDKGDGGRFHQRERKGRPGPSRRARETADHGRGLPRVPFWGYSEASVDDVAASAGVSKGTVYKYFESKYALFAVVVIAEAEGIARSLSRDLRGRIGDPTDVMEAVRNETVAAFRSPAAQACLRLVVGAAMQVPELKGAFLLHAVEPAKRSAPRSCAPEDGA